jgi:hypothetical protein
MRLLLTVLLASINAYCVFGEDYVIRTLAGNGSPMNFGSLGGFSGDNGPATKAIARKGNQLR